jgi:hypothetical protein
LLKTALINPEDGRRQLVEPSRAALVSVRPVPPFGADIDAIVFRSFLTDSTGSNDMTVLASPAVPRIFSVRSVQGSDLYIKSITFVITGTGMNLGEFGDQVALTDPCILTYETETIRVTLADDITTNFDLIRLGGELMPGVGAGGTALKVESPSMVGPTDDAYTAFVDFGRVYGFPWGIKLAASTEQRFDFLIQENLTAIPTFDCTVQGFLRQPDTVRA